jgi:hypothetical protein
MASYFMLLIDTSGRSRDAQPVQHVGHQLLEAHVLHAGHAFGALEVGRRGRRRPGACARCRPGTWSPRPAPGLPCGCRRSGRRRPAAPLDAFLDGVRQVGPAGADVGAEHVRAVALVVHAAGVSVDLGSASARHVAEDIDRLAADRRQEDLRGRAASPARGTCRRSPRTARGAGPSRCMPKRARRRRAGTRPARPPPWSPGPRTAGSRAPQTTGGAGWPPWLGCVFSLMCAMSFPVLRERESEEAYSGPMTKGRRPHGPAKACLRRHSRTVPQDHTPMPRL